MTKVDIGVACAPNQTSQWWSAVMVRLLEADRMDEVEIGAIRAISTALPDHSKNKLVAPANIETKRRNNLTDSNRMTMIAGFLEGDADWLWQIDDDTVPPRGALYQLLRARRDFIGGLYFLGAHPHNPIAYYRNTDGTYKALLNYPLGALVQVDSIGMGCTLIHRSVFEKIIAGHELFARNNGSLVAVHKSKIRNREFGAQEEFVENGLLHTPLFPLTEHDARPYPFYAMEYGRTEDHHFCELADAVGIKPYLDTNIVCGHIKNYTVNRDHYKAAMKKLAAQQKLKERQNGKAEESESS